MFLLDWLRQRFPQAKRINLKRMVEEGRVTINGRTARRLKEPLAEADRVRVWSRPQPPPPSLAPLERVYEDEDVLVVNKPPGLISSSTPRERRPTAIALVRAYLAATQPSARPGVIHRLDQDASGLLVFSRNAAAFDSLKRQFFRHTVQRVYLALVRGTPVPQRGRIESLLVELPSGRVRSTAGRGQRAITEYELLQRCGRHSRLRVTLHTGRKHQIRAHLSERGCPIVGDRLYGTDEGCRLMLAAVQLAFDHPRTGQRMSFEIPPPPDMLGPEAQPR